MKKFFKYLGIGILVIFVLLLLLGRDVIENDVDNFFTIPEVQDLYVNRIKSLETAVGGSTQKSEERRLDSFISRLENKYPNNSEVQSLRNSLNKAIVLQKEYAIQWEKDRKEERERAIEMAEQKAIMAEQEAINEKPIAMGAICSTNEVGYYMSAMENLRTSAAIQYIQNNNNCYLALDANSNSDIFTRNNSVVMSKGNWYLVLFNGKNYGATTIDAYEQTFARP